MNCIDKLKTRFGSTYLIDNNNGFYSRKYLTGDAGGCVSLEFSKHKESMWT